MSAPSTTRLQQTLAETLLVQTDANHGLDAIGCADRQGGGLVLTGEKSLVTAEYVIKHQHYSRPVLIDRSRYAGRRRKFACEPFDDNWISRQRRLKLAAVMPDAGYVAEGDTAGLESILTRVRSLGDDTIAPLGLHLSWLDANRGLATLIEQVEAAGVPVAIALEHPKDPLGPHYAFDGLVSLLAQPTPVIMLRCDVSAIGTLCFGALAAAIGTTTGLRHIYPLPKPGSNGGGGQAKKAAIVRGCLAYASLDKIDQAVQADPDNMLWVCECRWCNGRTLQWLGSAPDPGSAAYHHSLETMYRIRNDLLGRAVTPAERQRSWIAQCDSAMFQFLDVDSITYRWEPPAALENWAARATRQITPRPTPQNSHY